MTITTRLDKIAAALGRDDDVPAIRIVVEGDDVRWWEGETEIDRATVDSWTQVVVFRQRPGGPQ